MAGVGILLDSETCEQFRIGRVRVSVGNGAEDVEQLRMDGSGPQHLAVAEPIGAELRERNGVRYADALHGTLDQLDKGRGGCIVLPDKTTNGIVFGKFANGACGIGSEQRGALEGGIRAAIRGSARFRIDRGRLCDIEFSSKIPPCFGRAKGFRKGDEKGAVRSNPDLRSQRSGKGETDSRLVGWRQFHASRERPSLHGFPRDAKQRFPHSREFIGVNHRRVPPACVGCSGRSGRDGRRTWRP